MSDDLPETDMTPLAEGAAHIHEMYEAYMQAGFTEGRAFELATTVLLYYLES